jgi:hypothetical protein
LGTLAGPILKAAIEYAPLFVKGFDLVAQGKKLGGGKTFD